jgi:lipoprotein-anchoring transpeptidase ErfK/SrfK
MNTGSDSVQQALIKSRQALQQGDRQAARRWAEMAASQDPLLEEPWLILAALGSPRASIAYIEQAFCNNPNSEKARQAMHWAVDRLRKTAGDRARDVPKDNRRVENTTPLNPITRPTPRHLSKEVIPAAITSAAPESSSRLLKSLAKYRWSFLTLLLLAACLTAAWAFWPGNASPVLAFLHGSPAVTSAFGAPIDFEKPTYTPTHTATFTPTNTFTPTPTFTNTPTPTETFTPSRTPLPTQKPPPTQTHVPWPTNTPFPTTEFHSDRWIDVNLSEQMVYAYEGDTIVASFLVSTGVPAFPTVTGQFHIYMKLVSTLMAGDGYYLPNVPYTMYFYKGYSFHGTYWHNNFGVPMSHGCVNMYTPDAEWLFYWASLGTLVNVHY